MYRQLKARTGLFIKLFVVAFWFCSWKGLHGLWSLKEETEYMRRSSSSSKTNKLSWREKDRNRAVFSGIWTRTIGERSMMEWMNVNSFIKNWRSWHKKSLISRGLKPTSERKLGEAINANSANASVNTAVKMDLKLFLLLLLLDFLLLEGRS